MEKVNVIFFGSTSDSVLVLNRLHELRMTDYGLRISAVVTQPPRPVGREQLVTPTPVELWAKEKNITTLSFPSDKETSWLYENEQTAIDTLEPFKADLLISASYGQRIPTKTITDAKYGGLNVHPSLLPRWRGADPVPWAILSGDHQTGATIVTLSPEFDEGKIIAQKKHAITPVDETDSLRAKLFSMGAELLAEVITDYLSGKLKGSSQKTEAASYARRLTRNDGFIPWDILQKSIAGQDVPIKERPPLLALDASHITLTITKALRALSPWPGLWTTVQIEGQPKRLKILSCHAEEVTNTLILDDVQLEGKKPVLYVQFAQAYLPQSQTS